MAMAGFHKLRVAARFLRKPCAGVICCVLFYALALAQTSKQEEFRIHYERAERALAANNLDVAEQEFQAILRLDPNNADVLANLGLVAFRKGDYAKASRRFEAALRLKPALWNAEAFWGICENRLGHTRQAEVHLQRAFPHLQEKHLRTQVGLDLATLYKNDGEASKSISVLEALRQAEPGNPDVLYMAYRTYSDLAARALSDLAEAAPESARMHEILAQTLMSQNDYPRAIQEYQRALKENPALTEIHFELGQAILANSVDEASRAKAKNEFEAALAGNPEDAHSEYELGEIAFLDADWATAERHYSRAIALRPHFVNAQLGLAKVLTAKKQPDKALPYLLDAERAEPQNPAVHYQLGVVYQKLGRASEAKRELSTFQNLNKSKNATRSLFQEILESPAVPK
jgi:tetratricopeptide (TPR) repeat protein